MKFLILQYENCSGHIQGNFLSTTYNGTILELQEFWTLASTWGAELPGLGVELKGKASETR